MAEKKTVDSYRDRSYTAAVAQVQPRKSSSTSSSRTVSRKSADTTKQSTRNNATRKDDISAATMLPLLTLVDDRIVSYENKSEQLAKFMAEGTTINAGEEQQAFITDCQTNLEKLLNKYNLLHQRLISGSNGQISEVSFLDEFLVTERMDLAFLESGCNQLVMPDQGGMIKGNRENILSEKERELKEQMASGKYQQVVELYEQLPVQQGQNASYDTTYDYAQALLRTGKEGEAAEVLQRLLVRLQEGNQIEQEFKLMQLIADLQFSLERYDTAFERYVDIINRYAGLGENIEWARRQQSVISARSSQGIEVRNFAELLRSHISYNPDRDAFRVFLLAARFLDDFPESVVVPTVTHIMYESRDRGEAWFAKILHAISALQAEKKYQDALQLIDQLPMHEIPMDKRELLNSLVDELAAADFEEEESRRLEKEEALQDIWSSGQEYMRAKDYDHAIEVFSTLLETAYAERANDKIIEASRLAAQEDRRKAAELFVRASKMKDIEDRIAFLMKSRQLLKGIIEKYPQSGLIDKAQRNLERIEEEIRLIDPELLSEPENAAIETKDFQQSIETTVNGIPIGEWKEQVRTGFPQE